MSHAAQEPFIQLAGGPVPKQTGESRAMLGTPVPGKEVTPDGVWARWEWDGTTLTVQNDRLGCFPLYYATYGRYIAVSPSIAKLLALGAPGTLDDEGMSVFLRLGFFIGEHTPFKAIKALPPGTTLRWRDGRLDLEHALPRPTPLDLDRKRAIQIYGDLFRQAIQRRQPEGRYAVPLSGGRDSRHIVLELHRQGFRPRCVTAEYFDRHFDQDKLVAIQLARELGLPLTVVPQERMLLAAEFEKNERTNYCADEHAWYLSLADHLGQHFDTVYDGIGGDILSAGLFLDQQGLTLMRAGKLDEMANHVACYSEPLLMLLLSPALRERFPRSLALKSIAGELGRYADWPNPVSAFYFFSRTRREIALSPYRLLDQRLRVHAPYLDRDLFDFLVGLPAEQLLDKQFHTLTIADTYPRYAAVPYSSNAPARPNWRLAAMQATRLLPMLLQRHAGAVINRRALALRAIKCLLDPSYGPEFLRSHVLRTVYLMQLTAVAGPAQPSDFIISRSALRV